MIDHTARVVVVTGAASGIGAASAALLRDQGARVITKTSGPAIARAMG